MKKIRFEPNVPAEIRAIDQHAALTILEAIHRYADTGAGRVKPLSGEFAGFLRLRVGNHRVFFKETADAVHHPSRPRSPRRLSLSSDKAGKTASSSINRDKCLRITAQHARFRDQRDQLADLFVSHATE